jgi:hypothetical protein
MFKKMLALLAVVTMLTTACSNPPPTLNNDTVEGSPEFIVKEWFRAISEKNSARAVSLIRPQYPSESWTLLTDEAIGTAVAPNIIFIEKINPARLETENTVTLDVEYTIEGVFNTFTTTFTADKDEGGWMVRGGYVDLHFPNIDTQLIGSYSINNQELSTEGMFDSVSSTETVVLPVFPGVYDIKIPENNKYFFYNEKLITPNQNSTFREASSAFLTPSNFVATEAFTNDVNQKLERFIKACVTSAAQELKQYPCSTTPNSKKLNEDYSYQVFLTRTPKIKPVIEENFLQLKTITSAQIVKQWVERTRLNEVTQNQVNSPTVNYTNYSFNEQGLIINFILENYLETEENVAPAG